MALEGKGPTRELESFSGLWHMGNFRSNSRDRGEDWLLVLFVKDAMKLMRVLCMLS